MLWEKCPPQPHSLGAPEYNWEGGAGEGAELSHFCSSDGGREGEKETQALLAIGDSKQLPSLRQSSERRVTVQVVKSKTHRSQQCEHADMIQGSNGVWAELTVSPATSVCHLLILSAYIPFFSSE